MLTKLKDIAQGLLYGEEVKPWTEVSISPDGKQSVRVSLHRRKDGPEVVWLRFSDHRFPGRTVNHIGLSGLAPGVVRDWFATASRVAEDGSGAVVKLPFAIRMGVRFNHGIRTVKLLAELHEPEKTVHLLHAAEDKNGKMQAIYRRSSPGDEDYYVFPLEGLRGLESLLSTWSDELG
ncbi:hypothetical protein OKA05_22660 [Luteolibacter arcticus]|uniref:Uncharacterized protein n=1 Tax=Luteolibacter arcticus TaxID=1581411 RepID=A0ABT3GPD7_9BACT|nr:hypothetical protein [Luteolibacter arcticus]MCW1925380.1 hypothetical protein [Luteolibacter arcticus]